MVNAVVLVGRVAQDVILAKTPTGESICVNQIAVERPRMRKEEPKKVDYLDVCFIRSSAEFFCKNFQKGSWVAVQGTLRKNKKTNRGGYEVNFMEVLVNQVSFCGAKTYDGFSNESEMSMQEC